MTTRFYVRMARLVLAVGVVALVGSQSAYAADDLAKFEYKCLSDKQKEGAKYCKSALKAWSKWDKLQDDAKRDDAISKALGKLTPKWADIEAKALLKGVDCTISTETASGMATLIDDGVATIVAEVNDGLDLGNKDQAKCGQKLLNSAAIKCLKMGLAESKYFKKPDKDPGGAKRAEAQTKASTKFSGDWAKFSVGCPTTATVEGIEGRVDALSDAVVLGTVVSPAVSDDQFDTISPTGTISYQGKDLTPTCIYNTPYHFFAKRGSVNKLLMYYQGGGACWEQKTCLIPVCDSEVNPAGGDNPNNSFFTGFADLTDPENPFKDWNIVFVSYCTCDVHFGDSDPTYDNWPPGGPPLHVWHHGFHNAKVAEKFAREHFVNPEEIFVTGSSAGAYGAIFQAPLLHAAWPYSKFSVLGDAGNGVITASFLQNEFNNWEFTTNLPAYIPGVLESMTSGEGMPAYVAAVADYFPATNWAHYTAAFDGGSGGQTGFYNVMLNNNDPGFALNWWKASCAWNGVMRQQAADTYAEVVAANDNYRYYIATGSRHTMWGTDRVYTDTTGGVPVLVDWVNEMRTGGPGWVNVQADPYNVLFPGECVGGSTPGAPCGCTTDCPGGGTCSGADVRPCPLKAPFELSGGDTIVNCPSPSGAFLDVGESVLD